MRELLPHGAVELIRWHRRFARLGLSGRRSWKAALDPSMRRALDTSYLELMPPSRETGRMGCVIDVGLNQAQWLSALLRVVSAARVEAFEPNIAVIPAARDPRAR